MALNCQMVRCTAGMKLAVQRSSRVYYERGVLYIIPAWHLAILGASNPMNDTEWWALSQVLHQDEAFAGLHWFKSVAAYYLARKAELESTAAASRGGLSEWLGRLKGGNSDDGKSQNRELAVARLDSYAAEFGLLDNVLSCAQLLFQAR